MNAVHPDMERSTGTLWRQRVAFGVMVASGFAGLGYQIVWTQQCALWLGHEAAGVLTVVTAFFGGLAMGAWLLGARIENSARPLRWYAACELVIALWSFILALVMAPLSSHLLRITGAQPAPLWQWTVAFCGTFLLLLPATSAMGATLPAMARVVGTLQRRDSTVAALYASNTFGAVIGVLACAFWLVPSFGLIRTAFWCSVLNLVCAAAAMISFNAPQPISSAPRFTSAGRTIEHPIEWTIASAIPCAVSYVHSLRFIRTPRR